MVQRCLSCMGMTENGNCPNCGYPAVNKNEGHQLSIGTILRNRYQIGKVLGQGGFGITYLAWDMLMHNPVAVKEFFPSGIVYRISSASNRVECVTSSLIPHYQYGKERFLREASALVDFRDLPEVVEILDFIEENNTAYIVMEYIKGVDLAKYIERKGGSLTVEETFRILKPLMEALAKVHKSGIVHRDISPDNIMLDPMGGAKLLDFGAVRIVENPNIEKGLSNSTEAILKHGFAPLEQYNSRGSLGPWTDEYAMCATVWYCLTGTIPADASVRLIEGIDPDWSIIPDLPEYQQKALRKGISCRAQDRYGTMEHLLADLFPTEYGPEKKQPVTPPQSPVRIPEPQLETKMPEFPVSQNGRNKNAEQESSPASAELEYVNYTPKPERHNKKRSTIIGVVVALVASVFILLIVFVLWDVMKGNTQWSSKRERVSHTEDSVDDVEKHSHRWIPASCTEAKHCIECGLTDGSALGHEWVAASCTEARYCSICGLTDGTALGHRWIPATTDYPQHCSDCGELEGRSLGKPLTQYTDIEDSNQEGSSSDVEEGDWEDRVGIVHHDAIKFWVINAPGYSHVESIVYQVPGDGIEIEFSVQLAVVSLGDEEKATARINVYRDGQRIHSSKTVSGTMTDTFIVSVPYGEEITIECVTSERHSAKCIVAATVYYTDAMSVVRQEAF